MKRYTSDVYARNIYREPHMIDENSN